jgi:hypothetical protein
VFNNMMRRSLVVRQIVASNFMKSPSQSRPFEKAAEEHRTAGLDLAAGLSSNFLSIQVQLLKYRIVRLSDEFAHLRQNPADGIPTLSSLPLKLFWLFVFYQIGLLLGRLDTQAPVKPPVAL